MQFDFEHLIIWVKGWGGLLQLKILGALVRQNVLWQILGFRAKLHRWSVLYLACNVTGPSSSAAPHEITHSGT